MREWPDECVDLIVTSPPYNAGDNDTWGYQPNSSVGQNFYSGYKDNMDEKDYISWCLDVIKECLRVSRYVFWNVQFNRSTRGMILSLQNEFFDRMKDIFIWHKQEKYLLGASRGLMAKGWEYVFMLGGDDSTLFKYNNFTGNNYVPNIKTWYKSKSFPEHHATFPEELPRYFVQHFTRKDDIVCDPFGGVGTTAVACTELNRNWICIDIEPKYKDIAMKRLQGATIGLF